MLDRHHITERATRDRIRTATVERDYVLAHIVSQLHRAKLPESARLIFKGGTALRLVHFNNYRYSADLDFTALNMSKLEAQEILKGIVGATQEYLNLPMLEWKEEGKPGVLYVGPLRVQRPHRIKVDISIEEFVESTELGMVRKGLWEDLPEPKPFEVYSITEIAAEKLRCIIQRVECRDLYDLYRLTNDFGVNLASVRPLFEKKTALKGVDSAIFPERFQSRSESYKSLWDAEMAEHVPNPLKLEDVLRLVRRELRINGYLET